MSISIKYSDWSIRVKIMSAIVALSTILVIGLFIYFIAELRSETMAAFKQEALVITMSAESARAEMEAKWNEEVFTIDLLRSFVEKGEMTKVLAMVPVVTAWNTAMRKAKEGNYIFKVPKFQPRNQENTPDDVEAKALNYLKSNNVDNYRVIDPQLNAVRSFRAVRLSSTCLYCHGDPAKSKEYWDNDQGKDPFGVAMENWKVGEIHGAFEIIKSLDQADRQIQNAIIAAVIIGLGITVVGLVLAALIGSSISKPIKAMIDALRTTSQGDFTNQLDPRLTRRKDEIGSALTDVTRMNSSLSQALGRVNDAAGTIAAATAQISAGNQDLAVRLQREASSIEETAATIEELTATVKQNADNSKLANELASQTADMAEQGGTVVSDAIIAMAKVSESSHRINEITDVVNEIAFQTNLLALNAAVEAARAGEAGKGFAVVAGEVRNLAQRSGEAAKEIQKLIKESVVRVEEGNKLVTKSGESLTNIVENVRKVAQTVSEISTSSREQAQAIDEVNKAVAEMDDVVQNNAALVQETASASDNLAAEARGLTVLTGQFKLLDQQSSVIRALPEPPSRGGKKPGKGPASRTEPESAPRQTEPRRLDSDPNDDFFETDGLEGFEKY